jgi:hypothetical protein
MRASPIVRNRLRQLDHHAPSYVLPFGNPMDSLASMPQCFRQTSVMRFVEDTNPILLGINDLVNIFDLCRPVLSQTGRLLTSPPKLHGTILFL